MITLIKRANVPVHYKEWKKYDQTQHRMVSDKNSFYLKNKSASINFYWKYAEQNENHPNFLNREASHDVIRLEVQCKYPKLYQLSKKNDYSCYEIMYPDTFSYEAISQALDLHQYVPNIPAGFFLNDNISEDIVSEYFYKIVGRGDYFTLDHAKKIVELYDFRREKEERMLYTLEAVAEHRGIAKAKEKLNSLDRDDIIKGIKELNGILVNPVTIPSKWGIDYIPNLLNR